MNILIAMPCYGGQMFAQTAKTIMNLKMMLMTKNIQSEFFTINSESLISRGRNACVAYFLSKPEFTHLFFIDADIEFNPVDVLKIIELDKEIIGLPYPKKGYDWNTIASASLKTMNWELLRKDIAEGKSNEYIIANQMKNMNVNEIFLRSTDYIINHLSSEYSIRDGLLEVSKLGTGIMLIKREVITKMVQTYPEMKYTNDLAGYNQLHPSMKNNFYLFFDCRCEPLETQEGPSQRYLSEDYAFCKLCNQLGYKIWVYTNAVVHHNGNYTFIGNMFSTLFLNNKKV